MPECEVEVEELLHAIRRALEGYEERGYFTTDEVSGVSEALERWRLCSRARGV